jgi:C1A family cysteine protease
MVVSQVKNMEPIKFIYDVASIPRNFDARTKWPNLIQAVRNQGWCGSDWALTTTAVIGMTAKLPSFYNYIHTFIQKNIAFQQRSGMKTVSLFNA